MDTMIGCYRRYHGPTIDPLIICDTSTRRCLRSCIGGTMDPMIGCCREFHGPTIDSLIICDTGTKVNVRQT